MYRVLFRLVLARLDTESAHRLGYLVVRLLPLAAFALRPLTRPARGLAVRALGLDFPSPFGVAAGFDKEARAIHGLGPVDLRLPPLTDGQRRLDDRKRGAPIGQDGDQMPVAFCTARNGEVERPDLGDPCVGTKKAGLIAPVAPDGDPQPELPGRQQHAEHRTTLAEGAHDLGSAYGVGHIDEDAQPVGAADMQGQCPRQRR